MGKHDLSNWCRGNPDLAAAEIEWLRERLEIITERVKNDPDVRGHELAEIAARKR